VRKKCLFFISLLLAFELQAACTESFEELVKQISINDSVLTKSLDKEFRVAEVYFNKQEEMVDLNKFDKIPEKYTYEGRIYPSLEQQKEYNLTLKVKPTLAGLPKSRQVLESKDKEKTRAVYYFLDVSGCWKLKLKQINFIKQGT
jgi:hypothetical protein